jgi:hypothetical protein
LHIAHRDARPSGRVLLAHIRFRFVKASRQKALRERARSVAAALIGVAGPRDHRAAGRDATR